MGEMDSGGSTHKQFGLWGFGLAIGSLQKGKGTSKIYTFNVSEVRKFKKKEGKQKEKALTVVSSSCDNCIICIHNNNINPNNILIGLMSTSAMCPCISHGR